MQDCPPTPKATQAVNITTSYALPNTHQATNISQTAIVKELVKPSFSFTVSFRKYWEIIKVR
jgi:hypothetical protein